MVDWMDLLFGGQQQTSQQVNQYPLFVEEALRNSWLRADQVSRQPYTPYPEARVADFTPDQQAAFDVLRQQAGSWMPLMEQAAGTAGAGINPLEQAAGLIPSGVPYLEAGAQTALSGAPFLEAGAQTAMGGIPYVGMGAQTALGGIPYLQQAGQLWPGAAQQYMNPYTALVTDIAAQRAGDRLGQQLDQTAAGAVKAGAFGGSRHGVLEGDMYDDFNRQLNELYTGNLERAYTTGANIFGEDMSRLGQLGGQWGQLGTNIGQLGAIHGQLGNAITGAGAQYGNLGNAVTQSGLGFGQFGNYLGNLAGQYGNLANILGNLGGQTQQGYLADTGALSTIGQQQQALDQRNLDLGYQDFLNQRDWDMNRTSWYNNIIQGLPNTAQGTQTTLAGGQTNPLNAAIGTGGSVFSAGKTFGWW